MEVWRKVRVSNGASYSSMAWSARNYITVILSLWHYYRYYYERRSNIQLLVTMYVLYVIFQSLCIKAPRYSTDIYQ